MTLNESFERALRAENRAPRTIAIYTGTVTRFAAFLAAREMPTEVEAITRQHVEAYIADLVETRAANTAASAFRGLQRFFGWLQRKKRSPVTRWSGCAGCRRPRCLSPFSATSSYEPREGLLGLGLRAATRPGADSAVNR